MIDPVHGVSPGLGRLGAERNNYLIVLEWQWSNVRSVNAIPRYNYYSDPYLFFVCYDIVDSHFEQRICVLLFGADHNCLERMNPHIIFIKFYGIILSGI